MTTIHVHLDRAPHARARRRTGDADEGEGRWVTISGAHVHIGKGGKIDKGPKELAGKTELGAHEHHHQGEFKKHLEAAEAKGKDHPDHAAHSLAAASHAKASGEYADADYHAGEGNIKAAREHRENADKHAATAEAHAAKVGAADKPTDATPFQKPKAHAGLHADAEEDVKGSEKHEAEHKRLMGLYDKSKAPWERTAINNLVSNNAAAGAQSKAQAMHHQATALSERAKATQEPAHHRAASEALGKAIEAHGRAGGVGYARKQEELFKEKKGHDAEVAKADKAGHTQEGARHQNLGSTHGTIAGRQAHQQAARAHKDAASAAGTPLYPKAKAAAEQATQKADAHKLHDPASGAGNEGDHGAPPIIAKHPHFDAKEYGEHMDAGGTNEGYHKKLEQKRARADRGGMSKAARERQAKGQLAGHRARNDTAIGKIAARVAKHVGEEAADQDAKHKK